MDWQFVQNLLKGVSTFSGNAMQSLLAYAGILSFIYLLFPKLEWKMKDKFEKLRHHKVSILLIFILASVLLTSYNLYENKEAKFAMPDALIASTLTDMQIRLADLSRDNQIIRGKTFRNCDIYGSSVVLLLEGTVITNCMFDEDPLQSFILTDQNYFYGVVGIQDCVFIDCRFYRVGFTGNQVAKELIATGIKR